MIVVESCVAKCNDTVAHRLSLHKAIAQATLSTPNTQGERSLGSEAGGVQC